MIPDENVPVESGMGWVRKAALLADLANAVDASRTTELSRITHGTVERLLRLRNGVYVAINENN